MNTNYNFLDVFLADFTDQNYFVQHYEISFDDQRSKWYENKQEFPAIYAVVRSVLIKEQVIKWSVDIYFLDLLEQNRENEKSVMNNTLEVVNQFQNFIRENKGNGFETETQPLAFPLNNFDNNRMNGWRVEFNFETKREQCFGKGDFVIPDPVICDDATYTVQYENGTLIEQGTIPSGGSVTVEVPDIPTCDNATWELRDTDNNLLDSGSIASGGSATITAPDATVNVNQSDGTLIQSVTVPSGGLENYNVADSVITVNSEAYADLKATDGLNIPIVDTNGDAVNTTVDGGNVVVDDLPCSGGVTRSTATLMKTGQTTSYATGDDGDIQAGRDTDFLTLAEVPIHNDGSPTINTTTNRFTDTLGGQDYANDIILDWSTWNGINVLGYYKGLLATQDNWNNTLDIIDSLSVSSFSNWRLVNMREASQIINFSTVWALGYFPFSRSGSVSFWTSTTPPQLTDRVIGIRNNIHSLDPVFKTSNVFIIPVRTFNLSLSNILT